MEKQIIYVALLRGIGPTNPNMHPQKLKAFFEGLGFRKVRTVIASGNVVFESPSRNVAALEAKIEKALPKKLGFSSTAIVRSKAELEKLIKKNPFKGVEDKKPKYLLVTFFKARTPELCSVLNVDDTHTPEFMRSLDKKHGKGITSRTWKTIHRIVKKMEVEGD
jgi:uncharacterized protein (DUF1697 family)